MSKKITMTRKGAPAEYTLVDLHFSADGTGDYAVHAVIQYTTDQGDTAQVKHDFPVSSLDNGSQNSITAMINNVVKRIKSALED